MLFCYVAFFGTGRISQDFFFIFRKKSISGQLICDFFPLGIYPHSFFLKEMLPHLAVSKYPQLTASQLFSIHSWWVLFWSGNWLFRLFWLRFLSRVSFWYVSKDCFDMTDTHLYKKKKYCLVIIKLTNLPESGMFLIVIGLADIMTLNFFFLVKDYGSWKEIGVSISHFGMANGYILMQLLLFSLSQLYVSNIFFKGKKKEY